MVGQLMKVDSSKFFRVSQNFCIEMNILLIELRNRNCNFQIILLIYHIVQ